MSMPNHAMPIDVLADDLTGAADTAAAFTRCGRPIRVRLRPGPQRRTDATAPIAPVDPKVRSIDLDVRDAPPDVDVSSIYAREAAGAGYRRHVYVKIDSTLRGRVADAVAGVRRALPNHAVICAPAFPATGRTTVGAVPLVDGVELYLTRIWHTERRPAPRSLIDVLAGAESACLSIPQVRGSRLDHDLARATDAGQVAICDAVTDRDLHLIAQAGLALRRPVVWIGSAGLAGALALALADPANQDDPEWAPPARFLAVVGSAAHIAQAQVAALVADGAVGIPVIQQVLLDDDPAAVLDVSAALLDATRQHSVVVSIAPGGMPGHGREVRAKVADAFARLVTPAAAAAELLLVTGGATARAVLDACSVHYIDVVRELRPGVVLSVVNHRRRTHVITKAGAFGDERALIDVLHRAPAR
jgi:4-hydroxythreonine-4-phosphate dehydrogenase